MTFKNITFRLTAFFFLHFCLNLTPSVSVAQVAPIAHRAIHLENVGQTVAE